MTCGLLAGPGASPAAAAGPSCPAVAGAAAVPTPDAALGRDLAAAPARPEEVEAYLRTVEAASPRVRRLPLGTSAAGRPLTAVLVGDPAELAAGRLAGTAAAHRSLHGARRDAAGARRVAAGRPAFAWVGGSIHGNEPSGTEATLDVLHALATGRSCRARRTLDRLVTVLVPVQSPDGRAAGGRADALGFDLNRDAVARARPETAARRAGMLRLPPLAVVDLHEQAGGASFVPPYADPVLREVPAGARRLVDRVLADPTAAAMRRTGTVVEHGTFDLLYPGFGDSSASLLHGAAGLTLEVGADLPARTRIRAHGAGVRALLAALAADRPAAVRRQAADVRAAVRDGRAGRLDAAPDGRPRRDEPPVHGHVLRTDAHGGDAATLAARLRADGIVVRRLRRATTMRLDPWGPVGTVRTRLPAGTLVVPAAQPRRRWAQALLAERPQSTTGGGGSGDVAEWSQGLLAGVRGGVLRAPAPTAALGPLAPPTAGPPVGPVSFDVTDAAGQRLLLAALTGGRAVRRAGVRAVVATDADLRTRARALRVDLRAAATEGAPAAAAPRVVLVEDPDPALAAPPGRLRRGEVPAGWTGLALARAGVATRTVPAARLLADGPPDGTTHVVVPDVARAARATPALGARLAGFVEAGGTAVGIGRGGIDALAGLTGARVRDGAPPTGTILRTRIAGTAVGLPDGAGHGAPGDTGGLALPAGASPLVTVTGGVLAADGDGLLGRPIVGLERRGAGRVVTFAGDPSLRGYHDGGERLLLAALSTR